VDFGLHPSFHSAMRLDLIKVFIPIRAIASIVVEEVLVAVKYA
jgi:hypothetical protein